MSTPTLINPAIAPLKRLYLIRGLPGSGKSTLAGLLTHAYAGQGHSVAHAEADHYFTVYDPSTGDTVYRWRPEDVPKAHAHCLATVIDAMRMETSVVVVANTFTRQWEMAKYQTAAATYGYTVTTLTTTVDASDDALATRNVHHVPAVTIQAMRNRWEQ